MPRPRFVRNCFPHKGYLWNYGAFPRVWHDVHARLKVLLLLGRLISRQHRLGKIRSMSTPTPRHLATTTLSTSAKSASPLAIRDR